MLANEVVAKIANGGMFVRTIGSKRTVALRPGFANGTIWVEAKAVRFEEEGREAEGVFGMAMIENLLCKIGGARASRENGVCHIGRFGIRGCMVERLRDIFRKISAFVRCLVWRGGFRSSADAGCGMGK